MSTLCAFTTNAAMTRKAVVMILLFIFCFLYDPFVNIIPLKEYLYTRDMIVFGHKDTFFKANFCYKITFFLLNLISSYVLWYIQMAIRYIPVVDPQNLREVAKSPLLIFLKQVCFVTGFLLIRLEKCMIMCDIGSEKCGKPCVFAWKSVFFAST